MGTFASCAEWLDAARCHAWERGSRTVRSIQVELSALTGNNLGLRLDRVLVVALHEQRPDRDSEVARSLQAQVDQYRNRLERISDPRPPGFEDLFETFNIILWGDYDRASIYLADDLESIIRVSVACNATSQEFIFGNPYCYNEKRLNDSLSLLGKAPKESAPLVAVARIKIGDHLTAVGGEALGSAMAHLIETKAEEKGVHAIVTRCWAWPELLVLLLGKDLLSLTELLSDIGETSLQTLCDVDEGVKLEVEAAWRHDVGRYLISRWVLGKEIHELSLLTEGEKILQEFQRKDVVVALKYQLGVSGAIGDGKDEEIVEWAKGKFFRQEDTPEYGHVTEENNFELRLCQIREFATRIRQESTGSILSVEIKYHTKPGHLERFVPEARKILGAIGFDQETLLVHGRQSIGLSVHLEIPSSVAGAQLLFVVMSSFRILPQISMHLLKTTTDIRWRASSTFENRLRKPSNRELAPVSTSKNGSGYMLLTPLVYSDASSFEATLTTVQRIGRVESFSLQAWRTAIYQAVSRPEMFGSLADLYRVAETFHREVVFCLSAAALERKRKWSSLGPGTDLEEINDGQLMAKAAIEIGPYFQLAYQQRLQFSPIASGAPPTNGQLPYGLNQIVRMLDGVTTAVLSAALLPNSKRRRNPHLPGRTAVLFFGSDAAISTGNLLNFGLLKLSILQAFTPLSLCMLFHELGHAIIRDSFDRSESNSGGKRYQSFLENKRRWVEGLIRVASRASVGSKVGKSTEQSRRERRDRRLEVHIAHFVEDIFSHAVWRCVVCGSRNENIVAFKHQFFFCQAMGLRTELPGNSKNEPLRSNTSALESWALSILHLLVQEELHKSCNDLDIALENILADSRDGRLLSRLEDLVEFAFPYFAGELGGYRGIDGEDSAEVSKLKVVVYVIALRHLVDCLLDVFELLINDTASGVRLKMNSLFCELGKITQSLNVAERGNADLLSKVMQSIIRGEPVLRVPWEVMRDRFQEGPSELAILWVRQILMGLTQYFLEAKRTPGRPGLERDFEMRVCGKPIGAFADLTGGIFVSGWEQRSGYLGVRMAAIMSLSALATRVQAASLALLFKRERKYFRKRFDRDLLNPFRKCILRPKGSEHSWLEVILLDVSPFGLSWIQPGDAEIQAGDIFEVKSCVPLPGGPASDQRPSPTGWVVPCQVVWFRPADRRVGAFVLTRTGAGTLEQPAMQAFEWPERA